MLEMLENIILPENGVEWQKLRVGEFEIGNAGGYSPPLIGLVNRMLDPCADKRPSAGDILVHPFIKGSWEGGAIEL